jgi:alpha-galactosidase
MHLSAGGILLGLILMGCTLRLEVATAAEPLEGVWLFDAAPSYPGVTLMELSTHGGQLTGAITTTWYGPMTMQNIRIEGNVATFDLRNLNDRAHLVRHWSAALQAQRLTLSGDIWSSHVVQSGRRGTRTDAELRRFHFADLPPLAALEPDHLAAAPPMGWSSWNKFAEHIDDRTVRAMADWLVSSGLREAGYVYLNIDDGWQGERGPDGVLHPNQRFPDMKALADYVHARRLKLGIYSSPGPRTCAGFAGSYGHVAQDARTFAGWGIDYLKYDLCSGEWFYSDADTVKRAYSEMGAALRATGRPIVYSLCEYGRFNVGTWGRSVGGHLWRTTGDIEDNYATMARIGFEANGDPANAGPGGWNDPDMLEVGNGGMTDDEYKTHLTLWAMSAAPLLMGHDLRLTSADAAALLGNREVIAIDQDAAGAQGRAVRKEGTTEIWTKPLADGSVAVALFNRGTSATPMRFQAADAGYSTLTSVRDLWLHAGRSIDATTIDVAAHGTVMLRVSGQ